MTLKVVLHAELNDPPWSQLRLEGHDEGFRLLKRALDEHGTVILSRDASWALLDSPVVWITGEVKREFSMVSVRDDSLPVLAANTVTQARAWVRSECRRLKAILDGADEGVAS